MLERLRASSRQRAVGDALLDQRLVAGIGNMWKAEALWQARVSPWRALADVSDEELRDTLAAAHRLMHGRLEGARPLHRVYRRVGRACRALRRDDSLVSAGRERPDGLLVPRLPKRRQGAEGVEGS